MSNSTRFKLSQVNTQMMRLLVLVTLTSLAQAFTPPKIIYGGWTPILPGHPFFFGTARKKHYESINSHPEPSYYQSDPHYLQNLNSNGPHSDHDHEDHRHHHYPAHGGHQGNEVYHHQPSMQYHDQPKDSHSHPVGHKHTKNIYSYYPPQSSYDGASKPNLKYQPVYMEVPRKPMEVLEDPHQFMPYVLPPIKNLLSNGFHGGHAQAYLKLTNLGKVNPNAIQPLGHINLENVRYIHGDSIRAGQLTNHLRSHDSPLYPPLPHVESDLFVNNKQLHKEEPSQVHESINNYKGTQYRPHHPNVPPPNHNGYDYNGLSGGGEKQYLVYQQPKSSNASPYYTKSGGFTSQTYVPNHSLISHTQYPTTIEVYPDDKFTQSHSESSPQSEVSKELYSSGGVGKDPVNIVRSKKYPETVYAIGGPKLYVSPSRYEYNPYEALRNSYMPKVLNHYSYKNKKYGKRYRKPRILSDADGTPTIVDREVSVVHLPVGIGKTYSDQIEAHSTPQSTQILEGHDDPRSHPNPHFIINDSQETDHDGSPEVSIGGLKVKESDSIFVGTRGLDASEVQKVTEASDDAKSSSKDSDVARQFFHAYYASSEHVPPKGYTKMSLDEFKNLFQNAEIQYIPRKQADELRLRRDSEKRND